MATLLATAIGVQFGTLLGGALGVETVFIWPGVGTTAVTALAAQHYSYDYVFGDGVRDVPDARLRL